MTEENDAQKSTIPETGATAGEFSDTVTAYREAYREANKARMIITGIILVVVTLNAAFLVLSTRSFINNEFDNVSAEVAVQLQPIAIRHLPKIEKALGRLAPVYLAAFRKMIDREMPATETRLRKLVVSLETRAREQWPNIQDSVQKIVNDREQDFRRHLSKAVGREVPDEELQGILVRYNQVVTERLDREWSDAYVAHKSIIDDIEEALRTLNSTEPDLNRPVNIREAAGILLEFTGVEIQANS